MPWQQLTDSGISDVHDGVVSCQAEPRHGRARHHQRVSQMRTAADQALRMLARVTILRLRYRANGARACVFKDHVVTDLVPAMAATIGIQPATVTGAC